MNRIIVFIFLFATPFFVNAQPDERIIRDVLQRQVEGWNAGSIDEFMKAYWKNDSLMFIGKNGITLGWKNTRDNYVRSYLDTTNMGQLGFDVILVKKLSPQYFSVVGKWRLTRTVGNLEGYFTLLFRKVDGNWLIVSDHSS